ncbi:MAG TPA: aldo/keto reductase [Limnochordia bacterium]
MERRPYGNTGEQLSIIGFGGILVMGEPQSQADRAVAEAIDRGINYFDVAPSYGDAEERLGPALEGRRDRVFLACKTTKRSKEEAANELRQSLKRLRTDHVDLYQLHAMTTEDDFRQATGPGGALEAFVEAREQGLVRYIGFSAHSVEVALKLLDTFDFDSILFPVNWVNYFNTDFGPQVVAKAQEKGVARLALKAMAKTVRGDRKHREAYPKAWYEPIGTDEPDLAELALRFTLSQPVTAAIPPGERDLFEMALKFAERFRPLSDGELEELKRRAQGLAPIFHYPAA